MLRPDPPVGLVQCAWLFTRGSESIRIVRVGMTDGRCRLVISGPHHTRRIEEYDDPISCAVHQSELERRVVAQGFLLDSVISDRRRASAARPSAERRR